MYTEDDIKLAIQAGHLTPEGAAAMRSDWAQRNQTTAVDEEQFRLVTSFNDIFVVIACLLLLISLGWIGSSVHFGLGSLLVAASAWGLAEFFTRKRHMALPSIVLLFAFVYGVMMAIAPFFQPAISAGSGTYAAAGLNSAVLAIAIAGPVGALAAWLHWRRFHVPITVAAGAAVLVSCALTLVGSMVPTETRESFHLFSVMFLVAGLVVFWMAMRWDASDRSRQTRNADVAFWLHLLAAPLLVHPVFSLLGVMDGHTSGVSWGQAVGVLAVYAFIGLVSLAIDRRAMMVSALGYVLFTFAALFKQFNSVDLGFATTALIVGGALLLLSAFWHRSRKLVVGVFPAGLQKWLAPLQ